MQQMLAVENIIKMNDYEKQYKIINMIFEKLFKVIYKAISCCFFVNVIVRAIHITSGQNYNEETPAIWAIHIL